MTIKSSVVSERQKAIIETIRMRLTEKQSLEYLKEVGFEMAPATLYREKSKVEKMKLKRLYHIAKIGFQDQHLDRIDNTELCLKLMWQNYNLEQDPYKRFQMLKDIIMVQPYLSSYYETTKLVFSVDNNNNQGYDNDDTVMVNNNNEDKAEDYNDNRKF
ncbi:MAG: hypothetical protein ACR2F1_15615 [Nitrososphaeraceae archaeon]